MATSRKRSPKPISTEDARLFREAIGPVRRIEAPTTVAAIERTPAPPALARQLQRDEDAALLESRHGEIDGDLLDGNEPLAYRREHVPPRVLSRLKRAGYAVEDELDLHRMTASAARTALRQFFAEAHRERRSCLAIIHGKGLRSEAGTPVLRPLVAEWLLHRADVLAFTSAPAALGGTGALLVLIDRQRRRSG